ncbi:hypothetical protein M3J09_011001 [Ascochyta lentis]
MRAEDVTCCQRTSLTFEQALDTRHMGKRILRFAREAFEMGCMFIDASG